MQPIYECLIGTEELLQFPADLRRQSPLNITFAGDSCKCLTRRASVEFRFDESEEGIGVTVSVDPLRGVPVEVLDLISGPAIAARAGRIRRFDLPMYLPWFHNVVQDALTIRGTKPFWRYKLCARGWILPVMYKPDGPWKLEPEQGSWDYSTTASIEIQRKYLKEQPLVDLLTDLYNNRRFISPARASVHLKPQS